jgi:DNA-directed RNA polymerase subunit RPC12/RpoP
METYDTTYVCHRCRDYVPITGYSMAPDAPPLVIDGTCAGCGKQYEFSLNASGEIAVTEV